MSLADFGSVSQGNLMLLVHGVHSCLYIHTNGKTITFFSEQSNDVSADTKKVPVFRMYSY